MHKSPKALFFVYSYQYKMVKYILMRELAFRLQKGDDLKACIEDICKNINTAIVLSGVGSLYHVNIRLAKAIEHLDIEKDYEIVSLTGTISSGKAHIHISLADEKGNVIGGHLQKGCLINTTCEIVLGIMEEYSSQRIYDSNTGYDEIKFLKE